MLATVLKSDVATKVSIAIMDAFVKMRHFIISNKDIYQNLVNINNELLNHNLKLIEHDNKFTELFSKFDKKEEKISTIFYDGQIFDAYALLLDIFDSAKEEIIIIDNYAGKEQLKILKDINKKIIIISKNINDILIKKYQSEYSNIEFKKKYIFHDRFIIIDRKKLYSCGASFKDLGKKCFAINEMESEELTCNLLKKIFN